jgi:TonB family protein
LVTWSNPLAVFAGNLMDCLHGRVVPEVATTSAPDHGFWRDVDVYTPFPRRGLFDSVLAHAALFGLLCAVSMWPKSAARFVSPLSRRALNGYVISEYLPELHGTQTRPRSRGKHDPVLAKQEILSLPQTPDNLRQTIVVPPKLKLTHDVNLPNIVAYQPAAPVQPLAASTHLRLPAFMPEVVRPAAETGSLRSRSKLPAFQPNIVEPAPNVLAQANPRLAMPSFHPKVVEPAPDLGNVNRRSSANLAHLSPSIAEPVPPPPQVGNAWQGQSGQIIALSLHPVEIHGPLELPPGNRLGEFAASPHGRAEATGTAGTDASSGTGVRESKGPANAPAGISVSSAARPGTAMAQPNEPASKAGTADPSLRAKLMAAMRPPSISSIPRQPIARETTGPRSELENRIFAGRHSYTLSVNMPNLNSATGSWIIHFVERTPDHHQAREPGSARLPIAAPEVISKSDPAYPRDLVNERVQGTVILTAIIRADGSVADIVVVQSLDPRLDQNAAQALSHWRFRPALKDGQAIDLEAVITVPFRSKPTQF